MRRRVGLFLHFVGLASFGFGLYALDAAFSSSSSTTGATPSPKKRACDSWTASRSHSHASYKAGPSMLETCLHNCRCTSRRHQAAAMRSETTTGAARARGRRLDHSQNTRATTSRCRPASAAPKTARVEADLHTVRRYCYGVVSKNRLEGLDLVAPLLRGELGLDGVRRS